MDGVVEIIAGRERRRRWSLQDNVRIVAEANEPGSMIHAVAARRGIFMLSTKRNPHMSERH